MATTVRSRRVATAPTVVGVYDAAAANGDGVFLVGSVPDRNAKINITFSEPMNRESAKGVVLGRVDTSSGNASITLADTLKTVTVTWSASSPACRLTNRAWGGSGRLGKTSAILGAGGLRSLAVMRRVLPPRHAMCHARSRAGRFR